MPRVDRDDQEFIDRTARATRVLTVDASGNPSGGGAFTGLTDAELRASPVLVTSTVAQFDSVTAYGSASAPSAGGAVATIASGNLPAGFYEVVADVRLDGTLGTGDRDNFEVRRGASSVARILVADVADSTPGSVRLYLTLGGSEALSVNAVGAATASSVYSASVVATRLA